MTMAIDLPGYDNWLQNGDPENRECLHEFISWHGARGECQDCGEIVAAPFEWPDEPVQLDSPYDDYDPNSTENLPAEGWQHYAEFSADHDQESLNAMFTANANEYRDKYRKSA